MSVRIEELSGAAFLAFPEMAGLLESELTSRFDCNLHAPGIKRYGELIYLPDWKAEDRQLAQKEAQAENSAEGSALQAASSVPYWARTAMLSPKIVRFDSIGEAASALKGIQRSWAPYQYQLFRRASLIQEKLPYVNLKIRAFPFEIPKSPIGLYTLLDEHTMLFSEKTTSSLPAGLLQLTEDHENPPSRAYLKIEESLTLCRHFFGVELPHEGSRCFEAGACPGGWTWVLRLLGADVFAVDRAPLAQPLMEDSHVIFQAHDAFTLTPEEVCARLSCEKLDWVFSDVICYPERLLEWVRTWLSSSRTKNMICTIKMQGAIDWSLVAEFVAIPNSRVVHLHYNKHELTWMHCER